MARSLLVSGFDIRDVWLPDNSEVLLPPLPLPALDDFKDAVLKALDEPIEGQPLQRRVNAQSKICIVIDDLAFPVPRSTRDCRAEMLEGVLEALLHAGVKASRVTALVGTGLSRQWRPAELTEWLGARATAQILVRSHDCEASTELTRIADAPEGPVELSRQVVESDLVIHLSVVNMPAQTGTFSLVQGIAGYRTARMLNAPKLFAADDAPLQVGSAWHRAHQQVGEQLQKKTPVLQVAAVLNNELWPPSVAALLQGEVGLSRPLQMWNAMPESVRHRAARVMRSSYRPLAVIAGSPDAVAPRALELFLRQHEVTAAGEADVLLFGLPDLGPYSIGSAQNPVLTAHLALGLVANLFTQGPLLREGGVVVFANPLKPSFDARVHRAHLDFYEKVLRLERESEAIAERYEPYLAGRPEFVTDYQRRYAFHGAHPLTCWYQTGPVRRRCSRIIVAHGDPRVTARFGFMAAVDVQQAIEKACEATALANPRVRVMELPPPFFVKVQ